MASVMEELRNAVQRLAATPREQVAYLEKLGTAPSSDELAIEFSDGLAVAEATLPRQVADAARRLDAYLDSISGEEHAELWTTDALSTAPEWEWVRVLAKEVLRALP